MNTRQTRIAAITLLCSAGLLGGCALFGGPATIRAVDGITSSRQRIDPTQSILLSLHSLSIDPGTALALPTENRHWAATALIEHTASEESYLRIETFEAHAEEKDMRAIRTAMENLTRAVEEDVGNRIRKVASLVDTIKAKERKADADQRVAEAERAIAAATEEKGKAEAAKTEAVNLNKQLNFRLEKLAEVSKMRQPSESEIRAFTGGTKLPAAEAEDLAAFDAAIKEKEQIVAAKQNEKAEAVKAAAAAQNAVSEAATAAKNAATAQEETARSFREQQTALLDALSKPNVVVFRWNEGSRDQVTGGIAGAFRAVFVGSGSASSDRQRELTGYGVMNGFRRVRLVVGNDFERDSKKHNSSWQKLAEIVGLRGSDGAIVTSVIQAREVMYLTGEALDEKFKAKLDAAVDATKVSAALSPEDKAEIKASLETKIDRLRSLQNNAYLRAPKRQMVAINDWVKLRADPGASLDLSSGSFRSVDKSLADGWITVHAVTTTLDEVMRQRSSGPTAGRATDGK